MSDYRLIIQIIRLLIMTSDYPITAHKIARETDQTFSRSTCYRRIAKMKKIGLISNVGMREGKNWYVTTMGYEFIEGWLQLGL